MNSTRRPRATLDVARFLRIQSPIWPFGALSASAALLRLDVFDRRAIRTWAITFGLLFAYSHVPAVLAQPGSIVYEVIPTYGSRAPGTPEGVTFGDVVPPVLTESGKIGLIATLRGEQVNDAFRNNRGIWVRSSTDFELVARAGELAPGLSDGRMFWSFFVPATNEQGHVAFSALLRSDVIGDSNDPGVWFGGPGNLRLFAAPGLPASGVSGGVTYARLGQMPALNNLDQVAFNGMLAGPGVNTSNWEAVWTGSVSDIALLARAGTSMSDLPVNTAFINFLDPVIADNGQVAFRARLSGAAVDRNSDSGIWMGTPGALTTVARSGERAPGIAGNAIFAGTNSEVFPFSDPVINSRGQLAFRAFVTGTGINQFNDEGIWVGEPNNLRLLIREGTRAPGTPTGVTFNDLGSGDGEPAVSISSLGAVAFSSDLAGPGVSASNRGGIWTGTPGALTLVARDGDVAPGFPPELRWRNLHSSDIPLINAQGQVAFHAFVFDANNSGVEGLWAGLPANLQLVVKTGQVFDLGNGDLRTVHGFHLLELQPGGGHRSGFNNAGQLAFRVAFTDGTDAIVVATVPIPEPRTWWMAVVGVVAAVMVTRSPSPAVLPPRRGRDELLGR